MSTSFTPYLGLPVYDEGDSAGGGSKSVPGSGGWNDIQLIIDTAVGVGHTVAGAHKDNTIDKNHLKTTTCDGATIEKDATVGYRVKALGVGAAQIADLGVTAAKVADGAISTAAKIVSGIITGAKIVDGAIDTAQLADLAVTGPKIADGSVDATQLKFLMYHARVVQAGTSAPAPTVIKSTMGAASLVWSRVAGGLYRLAASSPYLDPAKTIVQISYYGSYAHGEIQVQQSAQAVDFYTSGDGVLNINLSIYEFI